MALLIVIVACVLGYSIGESAGTGALGFCAGLAIGFLAAQLRALSTRIAALQVRLDDLTREKGSAMFDHGQAATRAPRTSHPPSVEASTVAASESHTGADSGVLASAANEPGRTTPPSAWADRPRPASDASAVPDAPSVAHAPDVWVHLGDWTKRWFSEGNVPVKVGMLVLFAGVGALLKYASDQGWLRLPIQLRLTAIAVAALAGLAFGWYQRRRRRSFALAMQGGTIGVLAMTVFAAFRVYHLLPAGTAFSLLLVFVTGAGVLAIMQDAIALAVLGIVAGFAAPILVSTGSGNHIALFAWYALLNLAIFAVAWLRPWRALNVLGFVFTYAIATTWGVLRYEHVLFASTEPFLLVYFALYLAIPILYARQHGAARHDVVDGTLVFGNPLVAFALQSALLDGERMPLACSAIVLAMVYALLAWRLLPRMRVLGESFAVLATGFATLAVPLALSARSTACIFALEGAGLVWLGLRQRQWLPRITGFALQALAAGAYVIALTDPAATPATTAVLNGDFMSAVLIAASAFASAWLLLRAQANRTHALITYLWGLAWWTGSALREIERFVASDRRALTLLGFVALSAALAALAHRRLVNRALAWTSAISVAGASLLVLLFATTQVHPLSIPGATAFAFYAIAGWFALRSLHDTSDGIVRVAQLGWTWTWTLAWMLVLRQGASDARLVSTWIDAATLLPLLGAWALTLLRPRWIGAALATRFEAHRGVLAASQAALAILAFLALLFDAGSSAPLAFVPLINPVELVQLGVLACLARTLADRDIAVPWNGNRVVIFAIAAFAFVTAATLRVAHQLGGAPWDAGLWQSNIAQTSLTVVWSLLGVLGWITGSRRGQRMLWLSGAVLMGMVLAKLLIVDRAHLGNLFGIVSFIAYGMLCTVIGYIAPAPPRASASTSPA